MKMDIIKELNLLIQMHYSDNIDSRDEWLREIIYLKSRFESKVNNVVLDDVMVLFKPNELWRMAQKYNCDDFTQMIEQSKGLNKL